MIDRKTNGRKQGKRERKTYKEKRKKETKKSKTYKERKK